MDSVKPMPRSRRAEKIAVLVVLAAILVLFAIFWKSVLFPLIRLEMKHDLAGAQRLLADNGRETFESGASASITGDMLTTSGSTIRSDRAMLEGLGREVIPLR